MRNGDSAVGFSLLQRRRALADITKSGELWRLQLINQARVAKHMQRREGAAIAAEHQRLERNR
jgi:hypothetical protein